MLILTNAWKTWRNYECNCNMAKEMKCVIEVGECLYAFMLIFPYAYTCLYFAFWRNGECNGNKAEEVPCVIEGGECLYAYMVISAYVNA